jgi:hypothetical protein
MNQPEFIRYAIGTLERLNIPYAVVGSAASMSYGEPRSTQDLDIVIDPTEPAVLALCAAFSDPEFYVSEAAARDAVRNRRQFNVIHSRSAFKIDFLVVRNTPWSRSQLSRRRRAPLFQDLLADTASPEDVILGKLQYFREGESHKHLRDITSMLTTSGDLIDHEEIARWAEQLGVLDTWQAILTEMQRPAPPPDEPPPF